MQNHTENGRALDQCLCEFVLTNTQVSSAYKSIETLTDEKACSDQVLIQMSPCFVFATKSANEALFSTAFCRSPFQLANDYDSNFKRNEERLQQQHYSLQTMHVFSQ